MRVLLLFIMGCSSFSIMALIELLPHSSLPPSLFTGTCTPVLSHLTVLLLFSCCYCIMGSPLFGTNNLILLTLHNLLSGFVKLLFAMLFSCVHLLRSACPSELAFDDSEVEHHHRPAPSLVPVPVHFIVESIKEKLPVVEYSCLLERLGTCKTDKLCIVCLRCMKASDEVRELCSCCHVFHRECLDAWIDQGQVTCPLCRSKLSPDQGEKIKCGGDPWRRERMIYLNDAAQ